jgi:hypothetical protein
LNCWAKLVAIIPCPKDQHLIRCRMKNDTGKMKVKQQVCRNLSQSPVWPRKAPTHFPSWWLHCGKKPAWGTTASCTRSRTSNPRHPIYETKVGRERKRERERQREREGEKRKREKEKKREREGRKGEKKRFWHQRLSEAGTPLKKRAFIRVFLLQ